MTPISSNPNHWSRIRETGTAGGIRTMVWIRRKLGRLPFQIMLLLVIVYYYIAHGLHRRASHTYLTRLWRHLHGRAPSHLTWLSLRHFRSFGQSLMDKIDAWSGIPPTLSFEGDTRERFRQAVAGGRGGREQGARDPCRHHGPDDGAFRGPYGDLGAFRPYGPGTRRGGEGTIDLAFHILVSGHGGVRGVRRG